MKKKLLMLMMVSALAFGLAACGNKSQSDSDSGSTSGSSQEDSESTSDSSKGDGETYDVGDFTVDVPDNYYIQTVPDYSQGADEDGNQPISESSITLIQDGESDEDSFSKPSMYIYYNAGITAEEEAAGAEYMYTDITEFDYEVNGVACKAIEGSLKSGEEDDDPYVYYLIYIPVSDSDSVNVVLPKSVAGLSMDPNADDVKAIIESIAAK